MNKPLFLAYKCIISVLIKCFMGGVNCKSVLNYAQAAEITSMRRLVLSFKVEEIATFEKNRRSDSYIITAPVPFD